MPPSPQARLRAHAVAHSLFAPTTLADAIERLGFVQADPIRAPARAQDLILRHRVRGYRAGDLERRYADLDIEEDVLTLYGFLPRTTWDWLHPRVAREATPFEREVLAFVRARGTVHPRDVAAAFDAGRVRNAWGGRSNASTQALDRLHFLGFARIVRRDAGTRVYEATVRSREPLPAPERLRRLVLVAAGWLAPVPARTLQTIVMRLVRSVGVLEQRRWLDELLRDGALEQTTVDGIRYLWPAGPVPEARATGVRLLAPFDPVVWDRARFEHLHGWPYRFEAYVPAARRVRGYYALPLLWRQKVVGWANAAVTPSGALDVRPGYANGEPAGRGFRSGLDAEADRLSTFLELQRIPRAERLSRATGS